ncbi:MAG: 4Fe-4S binding protein [Anaerovoracaceae bacterium]|nr:4Fe-4S binding protein [Anaerovoracaceae bacterium]
MKLSLMYFSPTGTTKKTVKSFGRALADKIGVAEIEELDFTLKKNRKKTYSFSDNDLVVLGVPVYAGRVPNVLKEFLASIQGNGALGLAFVLYGNRSFDDALVELRDIMEEDGFRVIGAGAFVGEHSFSQTLGKGRPNTDDLEQAEEFAGKVAEKIQKAFKENRSSEKASHQNGSQENPYSKNGYEENSSNENLASKNGLNKNDIKNDVNLLEDFFVQGQVPYRPYYTPRNMEGEPVNILKVKPKTLGTCTDCKLCAQLCPMESISLENPFQVPGICIKCGACLKFCPVGAKYYDDEGFLGHKELIETTFSEPKENKCFF